MSLPASILDGLGEFWPFDEGAGDVAHGFLGAIDLDLTASVGNANAWHQPETPNQFGGAAGAAWPDAWDVLENVGDTITIGMDVWWGGFDQRVMPRGFAPGGVGYAGSFVLWQSFGEFGGTNLYVAVQLADPPPAVPPSSNTYIYFGAGVGDGDGVFHVTKSPPYQEDGAAYTWLMEITRETSTYCRTKMYVGGVQVQMDGYQYWSSPQSVFSVGTFTGEAATRAAAVWRRGLTDDEKDAIFTDGTLAGIEDVMDETNPLVGAGGELPFAVGYPIGRSDTGVTLATTGEHRSTRQVHDRSRRRYTLPLSNLRKAEFEAVLLAVRLSQGGSLPVLMRVPVDDSLLLPAKRYRILNAGNVGRMSIERSRGGVGAGLTVEIEEV